jgi:hypothetical protein
MIALNLILFYRAYKLINKMESKDTQNELNDEHED